MKLKIEVPTKQKQYSVYLQKNSLADVAQSVKANFNSCPLLIITDKNVMHNYGDVCLQSFEREGFKTCKVVLEGGEKEKSLEVASNIYGIALEAGIDREGLVVALGGGVIGDLAGFVAATYMRGIPYIQLPTTLLAMVDSSVGGKVAVNHPQGKNIIGAFHQPSLVFADVGTLETLPPREFVSGLAELIKYGVILDAGVFRQLETSSLLTKTRGDFIESVTRGVEGFNLLKLIAKAVLIKGRIVSQDEREKGIRGILNFGHTFGHALESATAYKYYLHGEAVAVGMMAATYLSWRMNIIDEKDARRIIGLLGRLRLPSPPEWLPPEAVIKAMYFDKKKTEGEPVFVLPGKVGEAVFYRSPPQEFVREAVTYCLIEQNARDVLAAKI